MKEVIGQYNRERVTLADDEIQAVWIDFAGMTRVQVYKYDEIIPDSILKKAVLAL